MDNKLDTARRNAMKFTALGLIGAGIFARTEKVAAMQASPRSITGRLKPTGQGPSQKLLLPASYGGRNQPPQPATYDRLPMEWNKGRMATLMNAIAPRGVQAVLLRSAQNCSYFTGYWFTNTERPQAAFMNKDDGAPWFFHPVIDNELVRSGWFGGDKIYFDFPHAAGGFPNEGIVKKGPAVDLFSFMLEGIRDKGIQGGKLGIDGELYPSEMAKLKKVLPNVEVVNIADAARAIRMVKTPEELALYSRAYAMNDRAHAFARDYMLTYGTDISDLELETATQLWMLDELYSSLDLADGLPNHGVATRGIVKVRAGRVNAYPHPNQPYYARVGRNMPIQVVIVVNIGGCGGENYRMFLSADAQGKFDAHGTRLWEVSQHCCDIQRDMQAVGTRCNDIAYAIHKYQVDQGMQKYIFHRPAHGEASEGHYPPYLALGDETVLVKNSVFSQEPGLYDPASKMGFNWSDAIVTGEGTGYRMSHVPYSKEWSFIKF